MGKPTNANGIHLCNLAEFGSHFVFICWTLSPLRVSVYEEGHHMGGGRALAARQEGNPRRALGDVGNLVGPLAARCTVNRNGIISGNPCDAMKNFGPVDRPVTRKFGATFANNHQLTQIVPAVEEPDENVTWRGKQRRTIAPTREICHSRREIQNPAIAQQSQPCNNEIITRSRAALLKKENESIIEKQDTDMNVCCEVEMEDAEDQSVPNIDEADAGNPMNVVDYVQDIYRFYRETEILSCVQPDYMIRQPDINDTMRAILIDWLIEVHYKFDLRPETLFLTVNLLDRYLSSQSVVRKSLQLVGVTAMLLACKYEEVSIPVVEDFVHISDRAYTRNEVLQMERSMLNTLQFNLTLPTPYVFIRRFLKAANSDKELEMTASFFMELCLVEYVMLRYPPSMLAAAAVYIAQCTLRRLPSWNRTLEYHTSYTEARLQECAKLMAAFHKNAGLGRVTCVHRKYSTSKFNYAAKLEPALFVGKQ